MDQVSGACPSGTGALVNGAAEASPPSGLRSPIGELQYRLEGGRYVIFEANTVGEGIGERAVAVTAGHYHASLHVAQLLADAPRLQPLLEELKAAVGYMMNARIDLESGCTKATAINTLNGGIRRFQAAIAKAEGR